MLEKLMDNPIAWMVLAILTIVSFVYAIYCQHKNKEKKEFSYLKESSVLIRKKKSRFEKLDITYDGQQIEDLCISKFTIWNSGNKTLNAADIVKNKELTIATNGDNKILDVEILANSEETNEFQVVKIDDQKVQILFNYVDKKDGVVIQVIHSGNATSVNINCKIKGGKPLKSNVNEVPAKFMKKFANKYDVDKFFIIIACIMNAIVLIMAMVSTVAIFNIPLQNIVFSTHQNGTEALQNPQNMAILSSAFCWIMGVVLAMLYYPLLKLEFNMGVPKKLKTHTDFSD